MDPAERLSSSCAGQVLTLCGGELSCWERFFWAVAAHSHAIIGFCKVASTLALLPPSIWLSFIHMQIMEPLFVAIPGTYESQRIHHTVYSVIQPKLGAGIRTFRFRHSDFIVSVPHQYIRSPSSNRKISKKS